MVTDTFFDLQRFDDVVTTTSLGASNTKDTLVGDGEKFTWQGGHSFVGSGTKANPVSMVAAGTSGAVASIQGQQLYLTGTEAGYGFAIDEDKDNWEISTLTNTATIGGDFSNADGAYTLDGGEVEITAYANSTEGFTEQVNGASTTVKAGSSDVHFLFAADGTEFNYTFAVGTEDATVGLDGDDKAVFAGNATDIELPGGRTFDFVDRATVSNDNGVVIETGDNTISSGNVTMYITAKDTATVTDDVVAGASSVFVEGNNNITNVTMNGTAWQQISGSMSGVFFESDGNAMVVGNGAVTVQGETGARVGFTDIPAGDVVVNNATVTGFSTGKSFAVELADEGFTSIAFDEDDPIVKVSGDNSFKVLNGGASYTVTTGADDITFDGNAAPVVAVKSSEAYTVKGADASYFFETSIKNGQTDVATINGARVLVNNNNEVSNYDITSKDANAGIEEIKELKANDVVTVSDDEDGYTAVFDKETDDSRTETVVLTANDAVVSLDANRMNDEDIKVQVSSAGNEATVTGIEAYAEIALAGGNNGVTYHIKNDNSYNTINVAAGDVAYATLNSNKDVDDYMNAATKAKLSNDLAIWSEVATVGSAYDTEQNNHGNAYEQFYSLDTSGVSGQTVAGYTYDNDAAPTEAAGNIAIVGATANGVATNLGAASHVTLAVGSGDFTGEVPVNIQSNEGANVVAATVNLTNSKNPSTVAVGTIGNVTASHNILLSGAGSSNDPNYAYIGSGATGDNLVVASSAAMIRHDGDNRNSIIGSSGNDTILAGKRDIVYGVGGADLYYDSKSYAIQDYTVAEGDAIIATRVNSLDEVTPDNIYSTGNKIAIGNGKALTMANVNANNALHVKVAAMDDDGTVLKARKDIVLANGNGAVDATAAGDNGALIIADSRHGGANGAHSVTGSSGADEIYVGSNDYVNGAAGNDAITIEEGASGAIVGFGAGGGKDTVTGWQFGFSENDGHSKLDLGGTNFAADFVEDQLAVSLGGGNTFIFGDTKSLTGPFNLMIDDKKYTVLRTGESVGVDDNDLVADVYFAQGDGVVSITSGVTDELLVDLDSEGFQNIKQVYVGNNAHATILGSSKRETVGVGGDISSAAGKLVSLGAENDVILASGDTGPGSTFYFAAGDGRDTIHNFGHYLGFDTDPDKQMADLLVLDNFLDVNVATQGNVDRIIFSTSGTDEVVIYEDHPLDYNNKMYQVQIADYGKAIAKIGYSDGRGNNFTYNDEVKYYVGAATTANDTLTVDNNAINPEIWLDSSKGEFYRGIGVVDASSCTGTEISIAGSMDNNTIIGGGEGTSSALWGGAGNNLLIGGAGADFFMYYQYSRNYIDGAAGMAEANHDTIAGYDFDTDTIYLGDIVMNDINFDATTIGSDSITVTFTNGGTLTVAGTQERTRFTFSNGDGEVGEVYVAERSSGTWTKES